MSNIRGSNKNGQDGFTLVELLIGIVLLGMLAVAFFTLFTTLIRSTLIVKRKAVASTLATTQMEYLKSLPYDSLAIAGGSITTTGTPLPSTIYTTVNGVKYTTTTTIEYADDAFDNCGPYPNQSLKQLYCRNWTSSTPSTVDTNPKDYKIIHVAVHDEYNYTLAEVDTQVSARVAETSSTTGALFVQVITESGDPLPGASVRVTNTTVSPNVDKTDSTDNNGYAIFYDLVPDTTNYDYVISTSYSGYASLVTIPPAGTLVPNFSNQRVFTQQSSSLTMILKPSYSNSLVIEATDLGGTPLVGLGLTMEGGYKKYTDPADTSHYNSFGTITTGAGGLVAQNNLVSGNYKFCGTDGNDTNCKIGATRYYLLAAVPYGGTNSFNPVAVPDYSASDPPAFEYGGTNYLQKVRLIFSTSSTAPRIKTISPNSASTSGDTMSNLLFSITGVNLPTGAGTVKLLQGGSTFAATCSGSSTARNCSVNMSTAVTGPTQLQVIGTQTVTIPASLEHGGINVTP